LNAAAVHFKQFPALLGCRGLRKNGVSVQILTKSPFSLPLPKPPRRPPRISGENTYF
jgi:hypothetical protein